MSLNGKKRKPLFSTNSSLIPPLGPSKPTLFCCLSVFVTHPRSLSCHVYDVQLSFPSVSFLNMSRLLSLQFQFKCDMKWKELQAVDTSEPFGFRSQEVTVSNLLSLRGTEAAAVRQRLKPSWEDLRWGCSDTNSRQRLQR